MSLKRVVECAFEEPKTYDEALELRTKLIREVEDLQENLAVRGNMSWRSRSLAELRQKREHLRSVKSWLRKNDLVKQSEWALLARAYALLEAVTPVAPGHSEQIEALLDAIELVVPGQYLGKGK